METALPSGGGCAETHIQSRDAGSAALPLALTALLLVFPVLTTPLMQFEVGGRLQVFSILPGLLDLKANGLFLIALFLGWCSLGATFCKNVVITAFCLSNIRGSDRTGPWLRPIRWVALWETQEVLALALVICLINLSDLGPTQVSGGFFLLLALFLVSLLASITCEKTGLRHHQARETALPDRASHRRLQVVWALVLSGFLFYIPANVYPVVTFTLNGVTDTRTILGGVAKLSEEGSPILATIVFVASVAIPLLKLAGLGLLVVSVQCSWFRGQATRRKMDTVIRVIGRWALLDIYIILILISMVDFGILAMVKPEPAGIYSFCFMVMTTLLATESFDPQLLNRYEKEPIKRN